MLLPYPQSPARLSWPPPDPTFTRDLLARHPIGLPYINPIYYEGYLTKTVYQYFSVYWVKTISGFSWYEANDQNPPANYLEASQRFEHSPWPNDRDTVVFGDLLLIDTPLPARWFGVAPNLWHDFPPENGRGYRGGQDPFNPGRFSFAWLQDQYRLYYDLARSLIYENEEPNIYQSPPPTVSIIPLITPLLFLLPLLSLPLLSLPLLSTTSDSIAAGSGDRRHRRPPT